MVKNYGMIYLKSTNVHLVKDMGMIPFKLNKNHNYNSTLITFKNGEFTYQNDVVKGLKLDFVKRIFNSYTIDGSLYLLKNSKKYDVLQMFHVTLSSFCYAFIYKLVNPKGKLYLKLDCSYKLPEKINKLNKLSKCILNKFFNKYELITVEQEKLYSELIELVPSLKGKLKILPNGIDFDYFEKMNLKYNYEQKENIILNVARIGVEEKNTYMLIEAFKNVNEDVRKGWELRLVGPVEEEFKKSYKEFCNKNPELCKSIKIVGNIDDRIELYKEYEKAKIFSLTSIFESFGIVFIEAAAFGDVIVSTDVGIAYEIVKEGNGALVKSGDTYSLTKNLERFMTRNSLHDISYDSYKIIRDKYDWDKIVEFLYNEIEKI
ncbi:glycosyltransferase family 4 protein [Clostridium vincentii]|uniref:UDP-D-galactose:(Glucosyl)lipopolysaccharide-1, 6-D-galactosyltransferase n=1 Tax=Clostridium vincentii TaxID=52704 RepID=A0A2T0BGD3_9CLOT|nr:glycosyltransferase family 4 protein [Clostridium vincentii]PRR82914.1 UDP-D-galactose:(glucosyl)lipopolysaccharide-1,6-D-galactosyltransferase [Clostridium vincentii]